MHDPDMGPPPHYFGDRDGPHWSAVPACSPATSTEAEGEADDFRVHGDVVTFMWDEGVTVPLWDDEGLLPDEPEWLRRALGASDELVSAITAWGEDMRETVSATMSKEDFHLARRELDVRARALVESLRREIRAPLRVAYRPR